MNFAHFGAFFIFSLSLLVSGSGIFAFLSPNDRLVKQRYIFLGEIFLLGGIVCIGEFLTLSLFGLYKGPLLWGCVLLNFCFLLDSRTRIIIKQLFSPKIHISIPHLLFIGCLAIFIFRNIYFLVDVDSHSTYLFAQKLWLLKGTSIFVDRGIDIRTFASHFDCVPYSLGIFLFGNETLFAQLINIFWRVVALFLVFGYTRYRFNDYYALAAALLLICNDHFFISGANQAVLINGGVIAFLIACAYNFWEGRRGENRFRCVLAIIFAAQLVANKYQMAFMFVFMMSLGLFVQGNPLKLLKDIFSNKKWVIVIAGSAFIGSIWFIRNYFATGSFIYPILSSHSNVIGFSPDMDEAFVRTFGGASPMLFLKYMNYYFIWPGITAAKFVILSISFLPIICLIALGNNRFEKEEFYELCFWLGLSFLMVMGTVLASHPDPRYFRYSIGILSFSSIFSLNFIFRNCLRIKKEWIVGIILIVMCLPGYKIMFQSGGNLRRPSVEDNWKVLSNKMHMDDIIKKHYPKNILAEEAMKSAPERVKRSGWDFGVAGVTPFSAFLLPYRPQLELWYTTVVKWDSYKDESAITLDIREYGLDWIINGDGEALVFLSPEDYARKAIQYNRHPKEIFYSYDLPPEIISTGY